MTKARIMKKTVLCLILSIASAPTFAADKGFNVASLDKDSYRQIKYRPLAPQVTEAYEYYEIKGREAKELRRQMTQHGSTWSDGKKYDSVTSWHVKWDYERERSMQSCSAEAFQATAEITIRYPKWVRTDDAPQELADKWDGYLAGLIVHEKGHRDMVVEAVEDLTRVVAQLPAAPTCAELDRRVRSLCHERMAKLNEESKEYDAATLHGAEQGAVFP
jgi:predicted secreted Zn-dependent protease